jgi:hypothetical protein
VSNCHLLKMNDFKNIRFFTPNLGEFWRNTKSVL